MDIRAGHKYFTVIAVDRSTRYGRRMVGPGRQIRALNEISQGGLCELSPRYGWLVLDHWLSSFNLPYSYKKTGLPVR